MRQLININAGWSFLKDTKEIPATLPAELERVMRITDSVMRFVTVRK